MRHVGNLGQAVGLLQRVRLTQATRPAAEPSRPGEKAEPKRPQHRSTLATRVYVSWHATAQVARYPLCGMGWMAPASSGVAMRHSAVVMNCI